MQRWCRWRRDTIGFLCLGGPSVLVAGWRGRDEQVLRRCRQGPVLVQARCWLLLVSCSADLGTSQLFFLAFLAKAQDPALPWDSCAQEM